MGSDSKDQLSLQVSLIKLPSTTDCSDCSVCVHTCMCVGVHACVNMGCVDMYVRAPRSASPISASQSLLPALLMAAGWELQGHLPGNTCSPAFWGVQQEGFPASLLPSSLLGSTAPVRLGTTPRLVQPAKPPGAHGGWGWAGRGQSPLHPWVWRPSVQSHTSLPLPPHVHQLLPPCQRLLTRHSLLPAHKPHSLALDPTAALTRKSLPRPLPCLAPYFLPPGDPCALETYITVQPWTSGRKSDTEPSGPCTSGVSPTPCC